MKVQPEKFLQKAHNLPPVSLLYGTSTAIKNFIYHKMKSFYSQSICIDVKDFDQYNTKQSSLLRNNYQLIIVKNVNDKFNIDNILVTEKVILVSDQVKYNAEIVKKLVLDKKNYVIPCFETFSQTIEKMVLQEIKFHKINLTEEKRQYLIKKNLYEIPSLIYQIQLNPHALHKELSIQTDITQEIIENFQIEKTYLANNSTEDLIYALRYFSELFKIKIYAKELSLTEVFNKLDYHVPVQRKNKLIKDSRMPVESISQICDLILNKLSKLS